MSITDKKGKEGKGKKSLSEELEGKLEPVLVSAPLQSFVLGDLNRQVRALHSEAVQSMELWQFSGGLPVKQTLTEGNEKQLKGTKQLMK